MDTPVETTAAQDEAKPPTIPSAPLGEEHPQPREDRKMEPSTTEENRQVTKGNALGQNEEKRLVAQLCEHVRDVLATKLKANQKEDEIAPVLMRTLEKLGNFYRSEDGVALYFRRQN